MMNVKIDCEEKMNKLKAFSRFISAILSVGYEWLKYRIKKNDKSEKMEKNYIRVNHYYRALNIWLYCLIKGSSIGDYLISKGICSVAVYGWGELGKRTCEDIERAKAIEIKNVIDKNAKNLDCKYDIISDVTEMVEFPQLIIVTPFLEFEWIKSQLQSKVLENTIILSLEDILYDIEGQA